MLGAIYMPFWENLFSETILFLMGNVLHYFLFGDFISGFWWLFCFP